jgi:hypothetical protein
MLHNGRARGKMSSNAPEKEKIEDNVAPFTIKRTELADSLLVSRIAVSWPIIIMRPRSGNACSVVSIPGLGDDR